MVHAHARGPPRHAPLAIFQQRPHLGAANELVREHDENRTRAELFHRFGLDRAHKVLREERGTAERHICAAPITLWAQQGAGGNGHEHTCARAMRRFKSQAGEEREKDHAHRRRISSRILTLSASPCSNATVCVACAAGSRCAISASYCMRARSAMSCSPGSSSIPRSRSRRGHNSAAASVALPVPLPMSRKDPPTAVEADAPANAASTATRSAARSATNPTSPYASERQPAPPALSLLSLWAPPTAPELATRSARPPSPPSHAASIAARLTRRASSAAPPSPSAPPKSSSSATSASAGDSVGTAIAPASRRPRAPTSPRAASPRSPFPLLLGAAGGRGRAPRALCAFIPLLRVQTAGRSGERTQMPRRTLDDHNSETALPFLMYTKYCFRN